ncbi:leucyl/phenylalanyl-tRNA--protein transferase [Muriicola jejuensis]|uniref:Leucyl/phenylalanyl-tRNA--protein transferase n=1 Tax=Muriicola jejuensis TaxID=504488 RepID=A0A6P0UCD9_9FLAO|nr:leucyl/phenylalanyl-tRNA--protein transferase [Muriicola jejuensis]NER10262.1 leucyl/phenylalanyl-tRNA--protein transferase [Muriicola jejuensis]SMP01663.1 leucyl/phenylalanyl-tRNA--protein transferase [Muriicola jejuensis]
MKNENRPITFLDDRLIFPPVEMANPEGLLAVGGDLSPERLILAYRNGIFPWFSEDSLILWWSPDPRMVLFPSRVKVSRSMRNTLNRGIYKVTRDHAFREVVEACAKAPRPGQNGTWITGKMIEAYIELHRKGIAHSYEVWEDGELVGGLYGLDLGHVFCGESMFSRSRDASKCALIQLAEDLKEKKYSLIDCQLHTTHLESLGAELIPRSDYLNILKGKDYRGV